VCVCEIERGSERGRRSDPRADRDGLLHAGLLKEMCVCVCVCVCVCMRERERACVCV
jgi:hypothetical protein